MSKFFFDDKEAEAKSLEVCTDALAVFGFQSQLLIAMEECAEFIVAANHRLRARDGSLEEFMEELADAQIALGQMQLSLFAIEMHDRYEKVYLEKLKRLEKRISERE